MNRRIASIDIFRALTMLLMIFVNDLWTLHGVPGWLEHTEAAEDGMGLADIVFPAFLFIVGLSIPFSIEARLKKGDSRMLILRHTLLRALALVTMGFFMVNQEHMGGVFTQAWRTMWILAMILAFFLIWNNYPSKQIGKLPVWVLQGTGLVILALLALVYRGGTPENPVWMRPYWWGILGLIGWAYLLGCLILLTFCNGNASLPWAFRPRFNDSAETNTWALRPRLVMVLIWIILLILNILEFIDIPCLPQFPLIVSASNHSLVMAGVMTALLLMRLKDCPLRFAAILLAMAVLITAYGFAMRPFHGISKIIATPAWTAICTGISMAVFLILYLIADQGKFTRWAVFIMPAGFAALTCYLVPDFLYSWLWPLEQLMPSALLGGIAGLIKSLLFSLLVVWITGHLVKRGIQLKV